MAHPNLGNRYVLHRPPPPELGVITPEQVAWVAGVIEGEGSFLVEHRTSRRSYASARIQVNMVDRDVIERLHSLCGGRMNFRPRQTPDRKDQWRWTLQGYEAVTTLGPMILPWLGKRRAARYRQVIAEVEEVRASVCPSSP